MRTTLDIPEDLMREAQQMAGTSSKTATVICSLHELIRLRKLQELRRLRGTLKLDINLAELRKDRPHG